MNILIGVSGGIAAYKIPLLIRKFQENGHNVKIILTKNAEYFITPYVAKVLSKNPVYTETFSKEYDINHIELSTWADFMIVAPATGNILSKFSNAIADDLLSTTFLAFDKPIFIFPSMNTKMYENKILQSNIKKLKEFNYYVFEPSFGELACGTTGKGRMPEIDFIYEITLYEYEKLNSKKDLFNKKCLLTLGSSKCFLDSVRYIENASSGKMGFEILKELNKRGALVDIVCSTKIIEKYPYISYYANSINFAETTEEFYQKIKPLFKETDIYISAGALSDFKSLDNLDNKIKKEEFSKINLEKSIDVLKELSSFRKKQLMVGFSLESDNEKDNGLKKMTDKKLNIIVVNNVKAIGSDSNDVIILTDKNKENKYSGKKSFIANKIIEEITNYGNN